MNQFLLFAGYDVHDKDGGWDDFRGSYATLEEAREAARDAWSSVADNWWHVVDGHTGQKVAEY